MSSEAEPLIPLFAFSNKRKWGDDHKALQTAGAKAGAWTCSVLMGLSRKLSLSSEVAVNTQKGHDRVSGGSGYGHHFSCFMPSTHVYSSQESYKGIITRIPPFHTREN